MSDEDIAATVRRLVDSVINLERRAFPARTDVDLRTEARVILAIREVAGAVRELAAARQAPPSPLAQRLDELERRVAELEGAADAAADLRRERRERE